MARIVGYIAASLDGYIADAAGSLDWLTARDDLTLGEHDYARFIDTVRTVVMGRATYDWLERSGAEWPYSGKRVIVVTSRPMAAAPAGALETRSDVAGLIAELRALDDGDVWLVGGGQLQMAFIARGGLDGLEVYVISQVLGGGVPLFPPTGFARQLRLLSAKSLGDGCARLHYAFD